MIGTGEIHLASQVFYKALVFVLGDFTQIKLGRVILFLRDDGAQAFVDCFINATRCNAMFAILCRLNFTSAVGFVNR